MDACKMPFHEEVAARHAKMAELISRRLQGWLKELRDEVNRLDPETLNIDSAGDKAELARQVLTVLVDRLHGFGTGARLEIAEEKADRDMILGLDAAD
jgi:hypothetical protein